MKCAQTTGLINLHTINTQTVSQTLGLHKHLKSSNLIGPQYFGRQIGLQDYQNSGSIPVNLWLVHKPYF